MKKYQIQIQEVSISFNSLDFKIIKQGLLILLLISFLFCSHSYGQQKTLGMTKHLVGSTENGYVLFAPMYCKMTYLIDKCGKKVHSWVSNYNPGFSVYLLPDGNLLRTGTVQDTFFNAGGKGGIIEKIDWDSKVLWSYIISNDSLGQHHDIYPMDNGNILVIAWQSVSLTEAFAKGRYKGTIEGVKLWSERIIELKPIGKDKAEIVWQWSLWDHLIQDENFSKPDYSVVSKHPELMNINFAPNQSSDWIHLNSIDFNKDLNQIVLSSHNTSEIWIIDHSTTTKEAATHSGGNYGYGGDFLYRWGNPMAYNRGTSIEQKFYLQHNAAWIPKGYKDGGDIMVFNNGLGRIPAYSSIEIITPPITSSGVYNQNLPYGPPMQKWIYKNPVPDKFYSVVFSGANRLFNGNTLICDGVAGKFFEIDDKNSIVWEYVNPVASDDQIKTDGEAGGNNVFRNTYYSELYSGFKGKTLTSLGPIEKNSYTYYCSLVPPDVTPPKTSVFFPPNKSINIAINTPMAITFNEKILKGTAGNITIFDNNQIKEILSINDPKIIVIGKVASILLTNNFYYNSRISILIDKGSFKDSSDNEMVALDSSNWEFNTVAMINIEKIDRTILKGVYPNPAQGFIRVPFENTEPTVGIYNSIGQAMKCVVKNRTRRELEIDIEVFDSGIYSILLNGQFLQFFVKEQVLIL